MKRPNNGKQNDRRKEALRNRAVNLADWKAKLVEAKKDKGEGSNIRVANIQNKIDKCEQDIAALRGRITN